MQTRVFESSAEGIRKCAELLRAGKLVAFPTETVYGLGANALDRQAVAAIFAAKARPAWDPVIVHLASTAMLPRVIAPLSSALHERVQALAAALWPGPLTLLLPRNDQVPDVVTAGRALVGVRVPAHPAAQALIHEAGIPIAAPSANRFGHTSPTTAQHVLDDLDGRIDAVLDGGAANVGIESTVLDASQATPMIYRPGGVSREQIARVLGCEVALYNEPRGLPSEQEALPSPGIGMRHYAPRAQVALVETQAELHAALAHHPRAGVLLPAEWSAPGAISFPWGDFAQPQQLAARLYEGLRWLDAQKVGAILAPLPPENDATLAIRDRLRKAARKR